MRAQIVPSTLVPAGAAIDQTLFRSAEVVWVAHAALANGRRPASLTLSDGFAPTADYVSKLAIKTPSIGQKATYLSGGNQQRLVIAKWLATHPKLLIVDEPTRGIDVGAKAEIHGLLRDLASDGMAIMMISSDLPEILAVSDRVLVMHQGRIAADIPGEEATQEVIMHYATGQGPPTPDLRARGRASELNVELGR